MAEQTITRTFAMDEETAKRLEIMAASDDRSQSYFFRQLVNQEFSRRYSQSNPVAIVADAQSTKSTEGSK